VTASRAEAGGDGEGIESAAVDGGDDVGQTSHGLRRRRGVGQRQRHRPTCRTTHTAGGPRMGRRRGGGAVRGSGGVGVCGGGGVAEGGGGGGGDGGGGLLVVFVLWGGACVPPPSPSPTACLAQVAGLGIHVEVSVRLLPASTQTFLL
jgi:hypothetical protein